MAWLWGVKSLEVFAHISVLPRFWRTTEVVQRGQFSTETPKLAAEKHGADS